MLAKLWASLFGARKSPRDDRQAFAALDRHAPLRDGAVAAAARGEAEAPPSYLCRETILGRDQRVAGYQFMLHEGTRNRIRSRSRRIHHVYAEVLVRNIAQLDIGRLLGQRKAFLDVPDSFLEHPSIAELPPANTALVLTAVDDGTPPDAAALLASVQRLRQAGYRIAIAEASLASEMAPLSKAVDFVVANAASADPARLKALAETLRGSGARATLLARGLPSQDDFQLCFALGASHFQGPFITRREDWHGNRLGPNTARLADMLARLRRDADTRELVALLKQDAALSLRLMRYINSAAVGLHEPVSSIERALLQLGRDRLYRWLMLLMYGADKGASRSAAVLENALVRARLMELLGEDDDAGERDARFLVGLLSLVDVVLQVPMETAMASLATAPAIEAAVMRGEGAMADLLRLAIACEGGDPDAVAEAAERCGISPAVANRCHLDAFTWALEIDA
jgi:EAL and modified HD-GYP domain-containing signal transduction protein